VLLHGVLASTLSKIMGKLQTVFVALNIILIVATIIALPVGKHLSSERNDAHYIFAQSENLTTWPTGWAFMLSWLSPSNQHISLFPFLSSLFYWAAPSFSSQLAPGSVSLEEI
jgi:hypothetical protein